MSIISLQSAKEYLLVFHSGQDSRIQMLLDSAEDEARRFMDRPSLSDWRDCCDTDPMYGSSSTALMPASVKIGILTLLQARWSGSPADQIQLREVAEQLLYPYRCKVGF
jgi:hypothetical protein